jgi:hypothetical protein
MIYEYDNYLDKSIPYLTSTEIVEYDISSAGLSLSRYYKLLPEEKLNEIELLPKHNRHIAIGRICMVNEVYNDKLNKHAFKDIRKEFFEANSIKDEDVLSIKKDAIFLKRRISKTTFGCVEFKIKNVYSSYYRINKKEFYLASDHVDVKGIHDDKLILHREYMLDFIFNILKMIETKPIEYVRKELVEFTNHYKRGNLHIGYYRELNDESCYRVNSTFNEYNLGLDYVDSIEDINI